MAIPVDVLEAQLLQLSKAERIRVLDRVVASLDEHAIQEAEWDALAAQRQAEAERDPSVMLDLDGVIGRLRAGLE